MLHKLTLWMNPVLAFYAFYYQPLVMSIFIGFFLVLTISEVVIVNKYPINSRKYLPKLFVLWMLICAISLAVLVPTHYYFMKFLVTTGMFLNIIVSFANGYLMPVKKKPGEFLNPNDWNHTPFGESSRFSILCDRFHHCFLTFTTFSLGDIFCAIGVIATFVQISYQVGTALYSYLL